MISIHCTAVHNIQNRAKRTKCISSQMIQIFLSKLKIIYSKSSIIIIIIDYTHTCTFNVYLHQYLIIRSATPCMRVTNIPIITCLNLRACYTYIKIDIQTTCQTTKKSNGFRRDDKDMVIMMAIMMMMMMQRATEKIFHAIRSNIG